MSNTQILFLYGIIFIISAVIVCLTYLPNFILYPPHKRARNELQRYERDVDHNDIMHPIWNAWLDDFDDMAPNMSFFGERILSNDFVTMLHNYRMMKSLQSRNLSIPVVVILGMPRTGTTMLLDWIAKNDESAAWLSYAQQSEPFAKHPRVSRWITDAKLRIVKNFFAPELDTKHHIYADGPDEEILLMNKLCGYPDNRMLWLNGSEKYFNMVSDESPESAMIAHNAYDVLRRYMADMTIPSNKTYWILKSPVHLYPNNLKAMQSVFPHAHYITTHRGDKQNMLASYASMNETVQKIFYNDVEPESITPYVIRHLRECWIGWCDSLITLPRNRRISFDMKTVTTHPYYVLGSALHKFGIPTHIPRPFGRHHYDHTRYGISQDTISDVIGYNRDY